MTTRAPLHLVWNSVESGRHAEVCEELDSVWLYLSEPGSFKVAVASWLLNTPEAPAEPAREPYRARAAPPPLPAVSLLPGGVTQVPAENRWSARWGREGHSVAVLLDNRPIGWAEAPSKRGFALYVRAGAEPWARPWVAMAFEAAFVRGSAKAGTSKTAG